MVAFNINYVICSHCRKYRRHHARLVCQPCYQMGYGFVFEGDDHHMTNHETLEDLERLIESQRPTMPADVYNTEPQPEDKPPSRGRGRPSKAYAVSPHGADCPLLKLIMRGEGGFSRALMEADLFIRSNPTIEIQTAWQSKDGQKVWVETADGEVVAFPKVTKQSNTKLSRDAGAACRNRVFVVLEKRGPMTLSQLAEALSHEAEYIRVAIRHSAGWFELTAQTRGAPYTITAKGRAEFAKLHNGKPLAGGKVKGRKLVTA